MPPVDQISLIRKFEFFSKLCELSFIKSIFLYGSRARGDFSDKSDIDIAINMPGSTPEDWEIIMRIIDDADTLLPIDCVRFDTLKNVDLKNAIEKDKVILFNRKHEND
ncbi:MAG: nucleotidyltransferase domain-containing protein [Myxococcales bacterium]|nr:nucleotidyltransferase domain-containing protein [Myxococcales bacterium]